MHPCETDSAGAIEVAEPIIEEALQAFAAAGDDKKQQRRCMDEARAFAKWLADALSNALRELEAAPIAEDKAKIATGLARKAADALALYPDKHPRLNEFVRMRASWRRTALPGSTNKRLRRTAAIWGRRAGSGITRRITSRTCLPGCP